MLAPRYGRTPAVHDGKTDSGEGRRALDRAPFDGFRAQCRRPRVSLFAPCARETVGDAGRKMLGWQVALCRESWLSPTESCRRHQHVTFAWCCCDRVAPADRK